MIDVSCGSSVNQERLDRHTAKVEQLRGKGSGDLEKGSGGDDSAGGSG